MEEVRDAEIDTNYHTAMGTNPFARHTSRGGDLEPVFREEEDHFHGHQPVVDSDDEDSDGDIGPSSGEVVPTEAEKHFAANPPRSAKRPRSPPSPDTLSAVPDLAEVFDAFDTPSNVRVSMCRAYASYISSTLPRKPKAQRRSKK